MLRFSMNQPSVRPPREPRLRHCPSLGGGQATGDLGTPFQGWLQVLQKGGSANLHKKNLPRGSFSEDLSVAGLLML